VAERLPFLFLGKHTRPKSGGRRTISSLNTSFTNIRKSRDNYEELKEANVKEKDITFITRSLQSDDFETFYRFYNIKTGFNKKLIDSLNNANDWLVQSAWFRKRIL
jgi:hypothetical protein